MGTNVKTLSNEIRTLLLNALERKGWYFFKNPQLCKCWDEMKCDNTQCPSYKSSNRRCWQVSGTFCNGKPQGDFAKKLGSCQECAVYKKATHGDPIIQIGEDFNNLMFQLKTKEDELKLSVQATEQKNEELAGLNRKIRRLLKKLDSTNTQLKELSIKDGLTGLYNQRHFIKILNEQYSLSQRYGFPLSCIMIDIDYFKAVNDTFGHQAGDKVLKQLADILLKTVRDTDKVVRYGGEEFVILLPHTDQDNAYINAERVRKLVSDHVFRIRGEALHITISLGIATYPTNKNISQAENLVHYADKALYQAKEKGRNQTVLYAVNSSLMTAKISFMQQDHVERRKYPRVQTIIKITARLNKKTLPFSNAFDISCSGMSVLSYTSIECNKILRINLSLPNLENRSKKAQELTVEGLVVRCQQINSGSHKTKNAKAAYIIGIQFVSICQESSKCLQNYFVSMFQKGCMQ